MRIVKDINEIIERIKVEQKPYYMIAEKGQIQIDTIWQDEPNPDIGFMEIKLVKTPHKAAVAFNSKFIEQVHDIIKVASGKLKVIGVQLWTLDYMVVPNLEFVKDIFANNPAKGFQPKKFLLATQDDVDNPPLIEDIPQDETPDVGYVNVNQVSGDGRGRTLGVSHKTRLAKFIEEASKSLGIKGVEFWDHENKFLDLQRIQKLIVSNTEIQTIYLATDENINPVKRKKLGNIVIQKASLAKTGKGGITVIVYADTDILIEGSKKLGIEGKVIWDENGYEVDDAIVKESIGGTPKFFIATEKDILDQQSVQS